MGYGHTAAVGERELSYEGMAEDASAFLVQLGIRNADLVGSSDGGQIALRLAFTHPNLARRVVVSGVRLFPLGEEQKKAMLTLSADRIADGAGPCLPHRGEPESAGNRFCGR